MIKHYSEVRFQYKSKFTEQASLLQIKEQGLLLHTNERTFLLQKYAFNYDGIVGVDFCDS